MNEQNLLLKKNRTEIFKDIANVINNHVHQEHERKILNTILTHTMELLAKNEALRERNNYLETDNEKLQIYATMYDELILPSGKDIEISYKQHSK